MLDFLMEGCVMLIVVVIVVGFILSLVFSATWWLVKGFLGIAFLIILVAFLIKVVRFILK